MAKKLPVSTWVSSIKKLLEDPDLPEGAFTVVRVTEWTPDGEILSSIDLEGDFDCILKKPRTPGDYALLNADGEIETVCEISAPTSDLGTSLKSREMMRRGHVRDMDHAAPGEASLGKQARDLIGVAQDLLSHTTGTLKGEREYSDKLREKNEELKDRIRELETQAALAETESSDFLTQLVPIASRIVELFAERRQKEGFAKFASRFLDKIDPDQAAQLRPLIQDAIKEDSN